MGGFWSGLMEKFFPSQRIKVLFRGHSGAGKTTIMYQMKGEAFDYTVPTMSFNIESIKLNKNITIEGWDLGGGWMLRQLDHHHYDKNVKAMIWVIDCSDYQDSETLGMLKKWFDLSLTDKQLINPINLILLNKIDFLKNDNELNERIQFFKDKLDLDRLTQNKQLWSIMPCCGLSGQGLQEAIKWLGQKLQEKKKVRQILNDCFCNKLSQIKCPFINASKAIQFQFKRLKYKKQEITQSSMNLSQSRNERQERLEVQPCGICFTRKITARIDCCNHQFCNTCIKDWVKGQNKNCPLCRRQVNSIFSIRTSRLLYRVRRLEQALPVVINLVDDGPDDVLDVMAEDQRIAEEMRQEMRRRHQVIDLIEEQQRNHVNRLFSELFDERDKKRLWILAVVVFLVYIFFRTK